MNAKKTTKRITTKKVSARRPEKAVIDDGVFDDVSWHQTFVDEQGDAIHSFEFKIPPATISIGEFVEFAFSNHKGRVIDVCHYIRDNIQYGNTESPHLRHFIRIKLETNSDEEF